MLKKTLFGLIGLICLLTNSNAQQNIAFSVNYIEKNQEIVPGKIINLAFMLQNKKDVERDVTCKLLSPENWKVIANTQKVILSGNENKLVLFSVQPNSASLVGDYDLKMVVIDTETNEQLTTTEFSLKVKEVEKISLLFIAAPENINGGETFKASYLLQNQGNTTKKVYIETMNCDPIGSSEIEIGPGQSKQFDVINTTSSEITNAKREYYTVRALISGDVKESIFRSYTIFPTSTGKKDLFFRYPISLSSTFVTTNLNGNFDTGYQFQLSGNGTLDPEGKHRLEFLARGPNLSEISFLGLYDQYYVTYSNKNVDLFVGEKAFSFTPLTESSRYGLGTENTIMLNNGLFFGFVYVKPRFYKDFNNELAGFAGFEFNKNNNIELFYVRKHNRTLENPVQLGSISAKLLPLKKTSLELEFSRGFENDIADNAFRSSLNTQFWIFHLAGIYYYTGENYPGYFSNSMFYSGNISAQLSKKLSLGMFVKEDFQNAELDSFFVSAPYTKSLQASLNYNIAKRAYLRIYWREFERKDRLAFDKFHYTTKSLNTQFTHKFKKINYNVIGEIGETKNLLFEGNNQQTTYRTTASFGYQFNSNNSVRLMGSWSNINSFVSDDKRKVTAGFYLSSQIAKNLKADFQLQNAYDIDDYYRNRNLMQLNLNYQFLKHHSISARSYYTLYRQRTDNPEFTATLTYTYNFGVPLKQVIKVGSVKGQISYEDGEPAEGVVLRLQNESAITDKNGNFILTMIQPGKHLLFVDRSDFEINQLTDISSPVEVDVFEEQETDIHIKIIEGAKLTGKIVVTENDNSLLANSDINGGGIIVELKNDFDQFRLRTDTEGNFSFPFLRPGTYNFRIYENSIPNGYEIEKTNDEIQLKSGEERKLEIELKSKKKNIIFKSQDFILTPLNSENKTIDLNVIDKDAIENKTDSIFYSIQVGAFKNKQTNESRFFRVKHFDFEKQIDNMYKYFIGRYSKLEEARKAREKLATEFKNPFIVTFKNGVIQQ